MDCGGKTLSFAAEWIVLISFRNKFGNSQREEGDEAGNSCCFSHGSLVPISARSRLWLIRLTYALNYLHLLGMPRNVFIIYANKPL